MKLNNTIIESNAISKKDMVQVYNRISTPEKTYTKKVLIFDVEIASETKNVETIIDGKKETSNTANPEDYILTGTRGETYVLTPAKFDERYKLMGDKKAQTKPVSTKAKEFKGETIRFIAP